MLTGPQRSFHADAAAAALLWPASPRPVAAMLHLAAALHPTPSLLPSCSSGASATPAARSHPKRGAAGGAGARGGGQLVCAVRPHGQTAARRWVPAGAGRARSERCGEGMGMTGCSTGHNKAAAAAVPVSRGAAPSCRCAAPSRRAVALFALLYCPCQLPPAPTLSPCTRLPRRRHERAVPRPPALLRRAAGGAGGRRRRRRGGPPPPAPPQHPDRRRWGLLWPG